MYFLIISIISYERFTAQSAHMLMKWNITFLKKNTLHCFESAKLHAMSAIRAYVFCVLCVPCVPPKFAWLACLRALRAYVSACLRALRAYVPPKFACLACLRALRAYVPLKFALIVISKFTCQYNTAESNSHSV